LGEGSRVLHGAVLTAENGEVRLGENNVVMENALVRGRADHPAVIGDAVMVGPHAHVNGATVEADVFIATGAALFPGSFAGTGAELRINSVLQVNSRLAAGAVLPIGWIAVGDPAQLFSPDRHDDIWQIQQTLDFPGTVYGAGRDATMRDIMAGQSAYYGAHHQDHQLPDPN
ncbi:MAG: gamma-carbonic anhydrase, partial [Kribbellaceae bacterium]|nr:gamma-carbonic anhydrase [Kribbellaceae bacterium]